MRKLGQHFLRHAPTLEFIAQAVDRSVKIIIEIGPGHGELTEKCKMQNAKCKILAIEKDKKLVDFLQQKFASEKQIEIIEGDALRELPKIVEELGTKTAYAIVGNIPYYITGFLFRTIGELKRYPKTVTLLIQKEVAERVAAKPPEMNRLAAMVQSWGEPKILKTVPKSYFSPPPQVESAVIEVVPHKKMAKKEVGQWEETVQILFSQPRKTILNNIATKTERDRAQLAESLTALGISPQSRPQNLGLTEIKMIQGLLFRE